MTGSFNHDKYTDKATNGEVGGVALDVAIALRAIGYALDKLSADSRTDISTELKQIENARQDIWDRFVEITGYTINGG